MSSQAGKDKTKIQELLHIINKHFLPLIQVVLKDGGILLNGETYCYFRY